MLTRAAYILIAACLFFSGAEQSVAQSSPNWSRGYVPTAGEYNNAFASKQDRLTFMPLNLAGGTMSGKFSTAPATINGAGFSVLPGIAPTAPANGDVWVTSSGFFVRVNGQTVTLLNQAAVAITGGTINGTPIGGTTPAAGAFTTLSATTPLPVASGGTGSGSASGARTTLGAAENGANSSITSLSGLTTPLSLTQGGTGSATAAGARTNLGAAASGANTDITSLSAPALGAATATSPSAGDNTTRVATTAFVSGAVSTASTILPVGQVRLTYSSATAALVKPYNGNLVNINGTYVTVPNAGVTCSNSGLAASTAYYAYLYSSGGTPTCEVVTTTHATNATNGVEIKSGDATRTLVGGLFTNASSQFADTDVFRGIASWFNRRAKRIGGVIAAGGATTSQSYTSIGGIFVAFAWADDAPAFNIGGYNFSSAAGMNQFLSVNIDGTNVGQEVVSASTAASVSVAFSAPYAASLAEGSHSFTAYVKVSGNTGTFYLSGFGQVSQ